MGGVYYFSDRGDRLLDLDALHEKLWQVLISCFFLVHFYIFPMSILLPTGIVGMSQLVVIYVI